MNGQLCFTSVDGTTQSDLQSEALKDYINNKYFILIFVTF